MKNRILNNSLLGDDDKGGMLPKSYTELLHAMNGFKPEGSNNRSLHYQGGEEIATGAGGVAFAQITGSPNNRGNKGNCHACGKPGHWATDCHDLTEAQRQQLRKIGRAHV